MTAVRSTLAIQLLIPAALFGYAAIANFSIPGRIAPAQSAEEPSLASYFNGGVTVHLEKLYRDGLPHRQLAVEMVGTSFWVKEDVAWLPGKMVIFLPTRSFVHLPILKHL